ncbi:MAG: hypothetical protein MRZ79_20285 [Bacteroidia bacterium]|nr:hypothetical protein [Bacteroidia bacterium]
MRDGRLGHSPMATRLMINDTSLTKLKLMELRLWVWTALLASFLLNPQFVRGQFDLPSPELLKTHGIRSLKVYRTALRFEGNIKDSRSGLRLDTAKRLKEIYYFNPSGKLDSIVWHPAGSTFYQKEYFSYGPQNTLNDYITIDRNKQELARKLIEAKGKDQLVYKIFERGKVREIHYANADSIVYKKLFFYPSDTSITRYQLYDTISDTKTMFWKNGLGAYRKESYQWFSKDGTPLSFRHSLEEKTADSENIIFKEKEYRLDSLGNVVNKYLGRFDDPYIQCNFYERREKLESIYYTSDNRFKADELFHRKEISALFSFNGIRIIYLYEIEYLK